jgi:ATP-dependent HslUV protease ATP-binding subunit HslU
MEFNQTAVEYADGRSRRILEEMTPRQIVEELDRYIVGQKAAKKAVAIAIRNRMRRQRITDPVLQEEIHPKNIIMIGPTGCGKTEIARRLARLTGAPFVKVEATKFTEVGYVGRDVESMIRDLLMNAINIVKREASEAVKEQAARHTEERLLDYLIPDSAAESKSDDPMNLFRAFSDLSKFGQQVQSGMLAGSEKPAEDEERRRRLRELMREKLRSGELDRREIEIEVEVPGLPMIQLTGAPAGEDFDSQIQNMLGDMLPKKRKKRRVTVEEARRIIHQQESNKLIDPDRVTAQAIQRTEQMGIVFLDEIDKIAGRGGQGPDVSREGVQRDLLPIVEGSTVNTRYGPVRTDHILFIAAGAFHMSRPSDLIPELQGRFPIRVELEKLTREDFRRILTAPENSITRQAIELLAVEGVQLSFTDDALDELSAMAYDLNEKTENIGARRLYTMMEQLLEDISFDAPERKGEDCKVVIDRAYVQSRLKTIVENRDLSQYIL